MGVARTSHGIADYVFVEPLGAGAHGTFWLAVAPSRLGLAQDRVAVKVLSGSTDEEAFRRTTRELRAFASARSPYLVTLYDAGQQDGTFFYSMEYFPDGSLAAPARPLQLSDVLHAMVQVAHATHALHEAGVVHRAIKPENVLLTSDGGRLSDLGLAQSLAPGQTVTGLGPIGSVEHVDPSILLGGRGTRATDIWSLGTTLHRAVTGRGVYGELPADEPLTCVRIVLSRRPQLDPELPAVVADVVASCLAAQPADRPRDALAVAELLERAAALVGDEATQHSSRA